MTLEVSDDKALFESARRRFTSRMAINLFRNNSIPSYYAPYVVSSYSRGLECNVKIANTLVTKTAIKKLSQNVFQRVMLNQ